MNFLIFWRIHMPYRYVPGYENHIDVYKRNLSTNSCYIASNASSAFPSCHFILPRVLLCCKLQVRRASLITAVQECLPSDKLHCLGLGTWMRKQSLSCFQVNLSGRKFRWEGVGRRRERKGLREVYKEQLVSVLEVELTFLPRASVYLRKYYWGMFFNNICSEEPEG